MWKNPQRRAGSAVALAVVATVAALAGCVADPPEPHQAQADAIVRIPVGAYDADHDGLWFEPAELLLRGPATVRFVNDDIAFHRMLGIAASETPPPWTGSVGDGGHEHHHHGEAGHGASPHQEDAPAVLFDVSLDPGESIDVAVNHDGAIDIHCHPHPWMVARWVSEPEGEGTYGVVVHEYQLAGATNGTTAAGGSDARSWTLAHPGLMRIEARLGWQDSGLVPVEAAEQPDTLRLLLEDSSGKPVAQVSDEALEGNLLLAYEAPVPWPATLRAPGHAAARDALRASLAEAPPDSWTFRVFVDAAPGALPASEAGIGDPTDGGQAWNLEVLVVHGWPTIGSATPTVTVGELGDPDAEA